MNGRPSHHEVINAVFPVTAEQARAEFTNEYGFSMLQVIDAEDAVDRFLEALAEGRITDAYDPKFGTPIQIAAARGGITYWVNGVPITRCPEPLPEQPYLLQ